MKVSAKLAILLFTLIAIAHLVRLLNGIVVITGDWSVPQWVSIAGVIAPLTIAGLSWSENK